MSSLFFYLRHATQHLRGSVRRTLFGVLCIAAAVAAITSLQTVSAMIQNTLSGNLQTQNRSDIQIMPSTLGKSQEAGYRNGFIQPGFLGVPDTFNAKGLARLQEWLTTHYGNTVTVTTEHLRVVPVSAPNGSVNPLTFELAIDAAVYPLYGRIASEEGLPLVELLTTPQSVVINRTLANRLGVQVGDALRLSSATTAFTLTGIVPDTTDPNLQNSIIGFYLVAQRDLPLLGFSEPLVSKLYWRLNDPTQVDSISTAFNNEFPYLNVVSTTRLAEQNRATTGNILQLTNLLGLLSLLIGGIGIFNTMQVILRGRMLEIAILKTIGLEAGQIMRLFLIEAALLGLVGSLIGLVAGWGLAWALSGIAGHFVAQDLHFAILPIPSLSSLVVGILGTTIFGFIPTVNAARIRPALVLHPTETPLLQASWGASCAVWLVLIAALIVLTTPFVGMLAVIIVPVAFVVIMLVYGLLWMLLSLLGRLPTFGFAPLQLALRSLHAARGRGAATLLALVIGVFTLSLVTLAATSIAAEFESSMISQTGGNVSIFAPANEDTLARLADILTHFDGATNYALVASYQGKLISVNDVSTGTTIPAAELRDRVVTLHGEANGDAAMEAIGILDGRDLNGGLPDLRFREGTQLDPEQANQAVMVLGGDVITRVMGLSVGDQLNYEFTSGGVFGFGTQTKQLTLTIVGITDIALGKTTPVISLNYAPRSVFAGLTPSSVTAVLDLDEARIPALRAAVAEISGVFVAETSSFSELINTILRQVITFPILTAALTLVVGGIVIANSVALSLLERRREVAMLKAVGLQREQILIVLLLENVLLGIVGGILGIGLSLLILLLMLSGLQTSAFSMPTTTVLGLLFLCLSITLVAAFTSIWGVTGETPLNVLRYE